MPAQPLSAVRHAQTQTAAHDAPSFWLGYEWRRDRFRYRFENASSFNTAALVPHHFEQSYRSDNNWLVAGARYSIFADAAETEIGITTERRARGEDYDTFFQPDGNIVVYGTTADVSLRGLRFSQRFESRDARGWRARMGYSYERDRSVFFPSLSTTTQTHPASSTSFWNAARETTISEVHQFQVGVMRRIVLSKTWMVAGIADVAPLRLARLTTVLPDKYPGQDIVFVSTGMSLAPRLDLAWERGRTSLAVTVAYDTTWNYVASNQFHQSAVGGGIRISFLRARSSPKTTAK